ncbi:DDE superfamily endonuclease-domain-containing protein [Corynascus novoguineensis]|uniref:DDE superfamily endonuclease-domain-containing protein n=1 Tax=Corynascus novoguineensis TaxID=1126955 RepID=A0AAN7CN21_9PEZI|nr:DDE superfamily endonuclease-domain-containing protein [Corynascus novoguineensis]
MREFGIDLSPNVRSIRSNRRELTPEERAAIIAARKAGVTRKALAANFRCSPLTITRTCNHFQKHHTVKSLPRKGRPQKLTHRQVQYIKYLIKRNPHINWPALQSQSNTGASINTIRKALGRDFRRKWCSIKRIHITPDTAVKRLAYRKENKSKAAMLMEGAYSDESSVQTAPNTPNGWVLRMPKHKYDKDLINIHAHVKAEITVMVWGCIWKGGRSPLVIMERDPESKRNGYSANSYIWALGEGLRLCYRLGTLLLQDNAKIHVARKTTEWLERHGVWVLEHPPHSPDLNPIEHVWKKMKEILRRDFPDLYRLKNNEENLAVALIDTLIYSMPKRLRAVVRARGWYTKY